MAAIISRHYKVFQRISLAILRGNAFSILSAGAMRNVSILGILVVVGITSFAVARTLVQNQRYEVMKSKQRVRDACKQDVLDAEAKTVS